MKIGGGSFGGGGLPGGGNPFGGNRGNKNGLPFEYNAEVIPAGQGGSDDTRIVQRNVIPADGGVIKPDTVIPADGGADAPLLLTEDQILGPIQPVIHVTVFARFERPEGEQLIKDASYLNAASGGDFHLVLAGYTRTKPQESRGALSEARAIVLRTGVTWFYDGSEFDRQVRMVEDLTTWKYGGGLQLLICDVSAAGRQAVDTQGMFVEGKALLEHVIVVDVDELKENKLFADFDRFFQSLRTIIRDIVSEHPERPTWKLSDRLLLTQSGVGLKVLAKAFKLDFYEALDAAKTLKSFAVRNIRKSPKE